jgi:hypothetical protein
VNAARTIGVLVIATALVALAMGARPAAAAPGDFVADVVVSESYPQNIAPSVAFDGIYLYHTGYAGSVLHRINVPAAGGTQPASGQVDTTIIGAPSGIMSLAYDAGRDAFWAVGGDGLSIYLLSKTGLATLKFHVDPVNDRPAFQPNSTSAEVKIAYDGTDDTLWYSPDAARWIYHYQTTADVLGTAALVAATPYVDVGQPPQDMNPECGYSQSSGVGVGGAHLFVTVAGCPYLFEYTKTGQKIASYPWSFWQFHPQQIACDDRTYAAPVFWVRDGWDGHIRAFEQPNGTACGLGGGVGSAVPAPVFPTVQSLTASSFPIHANSHAVAMPANVTAGDLLLCIFTNHAWATVTTPSGWTEVGTTLNGTQVRTGRYAKRADGTEGGTSVDFVTSITETAVAHVYRISGWFDDGVLTDAIADAAAIGTGTAPDPPALDPAAWDLANTLWIAAYGAQNLGDTAAYPADYFGGRYDISGGVVGRTSTASARRESAGVSEDPGVYTNWASQAWIAITIGIRPGS